MVMHSSEIWPSLNLNCCMEIGLRFLMIRLSFPMTPTSDTDHLSCEILGVTHKNLGTIKLCFDIIWIFHTILIRRWMKLHCKPAPESFLQSPKQRLKVGLLTESPHRDSTHKILIQQCTAGTTVCQAVNLTTECCLKMTKPQHKLWWKHRHDENEGQNFSFLLSTSELSALVSGEFCLPRAACLSWEHAQLKLTPLVLWRVKTSWQPCLQPSRRDT